LNLIEINHINEFTSSWFAVKNHSIQLVDRSLLSLPVIDELQDEVLTCICGGLASCKKNREELINYSIVVLLE
jgi:hypothetical protein